jgi:taurine dioxygenase
MGHCRLMPPHEHARPEAAIPAEHLSSVIGAVVRADDVANAGPTGPAQLRRLLVEHHVVFIRGFGTDGRRLSDLACSIGDLLIHPLERFTGGDRAVTVIEDSRTRPPAGFPWHTDLTWMQRPPRFGFLQALEVPPSGGDTLWASMAAAHAALSDPLRDLCSGLTGLHSIDATLRRTVVDHHGKELADRFQEAHPPVAHPLVRAHPDTGAPCLYINPMYLDRIVELRAEESAVLLSLLQDVATDPNCSLRWRWTEGDVAIWDEGCTLHRALVDHHPATRRMRRCTVQGDRPVPSSVSRWVDLSGSCIRAGGEVER